MWRRCNRFDFDVNLSSPYDTPQRYADSFKVMDTEGKQLGERLMLHDHQTEQPFTRDCMALQFPLVYAWGWRKGREQKHGCGGKTMQVTLPGR